MDSPDPVDHISDTPSQFGDSLSHFLSIYPYQPSMSPQDTSAFAPIATGHYSRDTAWHAFPGHGHDHIYGGTPTGLANQSPPPRTTYLQAGGDPSILSPISLLPNISREPPSSSPDITHHSGRVPRRRGAGMANHSPSPPYGELDELDEFETVPPLPPNATAEEKAQWLRKKNTLSARKNRKLKAMRTQRLEDQVAQLKIDKEIWKTRAETLRQLLSSHGIPCPNWEE